MGNFPITRGYCIQKASKNESQRIPAKDGVNEYFSGSTDFPILAQYHLNLVDFRFFSNIPAHVSAKTIFSHLAAGSKAGRCCRTGSNTAHPLEDWETQGTGDIFRFQQGKNRKSVNGRPLLKSNVVLPSGIAGSWWIMAMCPKRPICDTVIGAAVGDLLWKWESVPCTCNPGGGDDRLSSFKAFHPPSNVPQPEIWSWKMSIYQFWKMKEALHRSLQNGYELSLNCQQIIL